MATGAHRVRHLVDSSMGGFAGVALLAAPAGSLIEFPISSQAIYIKVCVALQVGKARLYVFALVARLEECLFPHQPAFTWRSMFMNIAEICRAGARSGGWARPRDHVRRLAGVAAGIYSITPASTANPCP